MTFPFMARLRADSDQHTGKRISFAMRMDFAAIYGFSTPDSFSHWSIHMSDLPRPCVAHPELVRFKYPLPHLARALKLQRKIRIVTIGSSSTAGEGDIVPYPDRLQLALRKKFQDRMID